MDGRGIATSMLPRKENLPAVLPTERLMANGMLRPKERARFRAIPNKRNVVTVFLAYVQCIAPVAAAVAIGHPLVWVSASLLGARSITLLGTLAHEAAHRLLFSSARWNDSVGRWLLGYPAFFPTDLYRRGHLAHHKAEFGPDEPDRNAYAHYPISRASFRRKMTRDLFFISGWRYLRSLLRGLRQPGARRQMAQLLGVQGLLLGVAIAARRPEIYVLLWLLPWLTLWRALTRLRMIAEHGGMVRSEDRRLTTHHVRQTWCARFWIVPYNLGWHLAHHVDMGIPFRRLPAFHQELVTSGWVGPDIEHRSYIVLWRRLTSLPG